MHALSPRGGRMTWRAWVRTLNQTQVPTERSWCQFREHWTTLLRKALQLCCRWLHSNMRDTVLTIASMAIALMEHIGLLIALAIRDTCHVCCAAIIRLAEFGLENTVREKSGQKGRTEQAHFAKKTSRCISNETYACIAALPFGSNAFHNRSSWPASTLLIAIVRPMYGRRPISSWNHQLPS